MNDRPTPETDAAVTTFISISKLKKRFECSTGKVSAEFARRMERERDEAREVLREIAEASGFDNIGNWARNKALEALKTK